MSKEKQTDGKSYIQGGDGLYYEINDKGEIIGDGFDEYEYQNIDLKKLSKEQLMQVLDMDIENLNNSLAQYNLELIDFELHDIESLKSQIPISQPFANETAQLDRNQVSSLEFCLSILRDFKNNSNMFLQEDGRFYIDKIIIMDKNNENKIIKI